MIDRANIKTYKSATPASERLANALKREPDTPTEPMESTTPPEQPVDEIGTPARQLNKESDVEVPLRWAIICGAFALPIGIIGVGIVNGILHALHVVLPTLPLLAASITVCFLVSFAVAAYVFVFMMRESLKHIWKWETRVRVDLDGDGHVGKPSVRQPRGRTVIQPRHKKTPKSWHDLDEKYKVADLYELARVVWNRQQGGIISNGQRALRGTPLPSGFALSDPIHAILLEDLDDAGVIRYSGKSWELTEPPHVVRKLVRAEDE